MDAGVESSAVNGANARRRPRVLLAACGSVAAVQLSIIASGVAMFADVKAVATRAATHFVDRPSLPAGVSLSIDEDDWSSWKRLGDNVLHVELCQWADVLVIAPMSANTMAKIANGLCDNLLTCVVRAWDYSKPMLVAPAMNAALYGSPFTEKYWKVFDELGIRVVLPMTKTTASSGKEGEAGAIAEAGRITEAVRAALKRRADTFLR